MVDAGYAFLKWKQEAPTMTMPPDLLDAMANMLFTTTCQPAELLRSIVDTTTTPRWSSSQIIINDKVMMTASMPMAA
jgi:ribosomal protein L16 Arg81 hydroxylase